jgi:hypothetical protein
MAFVSLHTGPGPSTLVYLQNSGEFAKTRRFDATILFCNATLSETTGVLNKATRFLFQHYHNYPVRWADVMDQKLFGPESKTETPEGDAIGAFFRNRCTLVDDHTFHSASVLPGKTLFEPPVLRQSVLPMNMPSKMDIAMATCGFKNGYHECQVEERTGSIDDLRSLRTIILHMVVDQDRHAWEISPHHQHAAIIASLDQLKTEIK